jgi:hypothetical protein
VKECSVGVFACELNGRPARSFLAAGRRWNSQPGRRATFPAVTDALHEAVLFG